MKHKDVKIWNEIIAMLYNANKFDKARQLVNKLREEQQKMKFGDGSDPIYLQKLADNYTKEVDRVCDQYCLDITQDITQKELIVIYPSYCICIDITKEKKDGNN